MKKVTFFLMLMALTITTLSLKAQSLTIPAGGGNKKAAWFSECLE